MTITGVSPLFNICAFGWCRYAIIAYFRCRVRATGIGELDRVAEAGPHLPQLLAAVVSLRLCIQPVEIPDFNQSRYQIELIKYTN